MHIATVCMNFHKDHFIYDTSNYVSGIYSEIGGELFGTRIFWGKNVLC